MGYESEAMRAGRILSHQEITDLTAGFELSSKQPFSILVVPKANITAGVISTPDNAGLMVDCKCYSDDESSGLPVMFNQWTEAAIISIGIAAIDLTTYRVFWGAGTNVAES